MTNVETDWAASYRMLPTFETELAAAVGAVTTRKIPSATAIKITSLRTPVTRSGPLEQPRHWYPGQEGTGYRHPSSVPSFRMTDSSRHIACVGGIVFDPDGRLLLVRRGNEPGRGLWSVPGGRVEAGEDDHTAVVRELTEETGLVVRPGRLVGVVHRGPYRIADYLCTLAPDAAAEPRAGDDAEDARFVDRAGYAALDVVDGLTETLRGWNALPRH